MGALCSCCGGKGTSGSGAGGYSNFASDGQSPGQGVPQSSEASAAARQAAAAAAEAREAKFNQSAGGKAARKAVANVAKEREADAASRRDNNNAKDWLT